MIADFGKELLKSSTHEPSLDRLNQSVTRSLDTFDRKAEEILPKKRHIHDKDFDYDQISLFKSPKLKNIKDGMSSPSLNFDPKWPIVKLLSETDNIEENPSYIEDFDSIHQPFYDHTENRSRTIEITKSAPKDDFNDVENNKSSYKSNLSPGLKNLSARALPSDARRQCGCMGKETAPHICTPPPTMFTECTRNAVSLTMMPFYMPYQPFLFTFQPMPSVIITTSTTATTTRPCATDPRTISFPQNIPCGFPMGIPMGMPAPPPIAIPAVPPMALPGGPPMGYPMGFPPPPPMGNQPSMGVQPPMGIQPPMGYQMGVPPGAPNYQYAPNGFEKPKKPKRPQNQEEYDYDEEGKLLYIYNDNRDTDEKERKLKDEKRKDDIVINIDYEDKLNDKIKWNSLFFNKKPEKFVKEVIDDLDAQGDTLGKKCFCLSFAPKTSLCVSIFHLLCCCLFILINQI